MLYLTNDKLVQFEKVKNVVKPFWNSVCQELSSNLWLPDRINVKKNTLSFDIGKYIHSHVRKTSHVAFPVTSQLDLTSLQENSKKKKTGISRRKTTLPENVVIGTKKIRFYPKQTKNYYDMCSVFRRGYNLTVEHLNTGKYKNIENLRGHICKIVESECLEIGRVYNCNVVQESVDSAKYEFSKVCSKNKILKKNNQKGENYSTLKFKSGKETQQTFVLNKMPRLTHPCPRVLGKIKLTEKIPEEAFDQQVKVTVEFGQWFLLVQYHITLSAESQGKVNCIALDPGVRNFMTGYSESEVFFAGQNLQEVLLPLALKARKLQSEKQKLSNIGKQFPDNFNEKPLWFQHRWRFLNRQIERTKVKKNNIIRSLHHELAHYLVSHYDIIFLPTYEVKRMTAKKSRNTSKSTVFNMLALCHYQFKLTLKWYARKYGKRVIDVNEAYTSKTDWKGNINQDLKKETIIKSDDIVLDRDINGARNIYIKQLSLIFPHKAYLA